MYLECLYIFYFCFVYSYRRVVQNQSEIKSITPFITGDARPIAQNFHLGSGRHNRLACRSYFREAVGLSFVTTITEHGCIPVIDTLIGIHAGRKIIHHLFVLCFNIFSR